MGIDPDLIRVDELRAQAVAYRDALLPRLDQFATDRDAFDDAIDLGLAALARLEARAEELDALGEERSVAALGNVESATTTATAVMALILVGVLVAGFVLVVVALRVLGELRRLAATQQATADQLRQALRARSDFIADASHELRTPLTVLRGNAEVGLAMGTTRCEHEPILRDIVAESERMTRLVGDLLFLARSGVGSTPLEPRTVELEPWLAEVAARGEVLCRQRDMPLDVDLAAVGTARIDPERTEQAVMVLIDNAAKFSPPGTPVRLEARLSDVELVIVVEDRGPGIPDDLRPYVFDRFRRGDRARGRRQSGAGLGLSIAQVIVDGQGGRIDAHDRPGGGTRMVIRLPRWGGPLSAAPIGTREPATAWDGP